MTKAFSLSALLPLMIIISAFAQKLPNVQEISVRAPANIRVDGKPAEWNNQFQAYNKATEIYYTLSNDNEKLYLTVKATDPDIVNKIICAGIVLTINASGKLKDEGGVAVRFPVLDKSTFPVNKPPIDLDNGFGLSADAFLLSLNKQITALTKDILVEGVTEIPNHLLSIYNPEGIKAAVLFDDQTNLNYEIAIPLKYLSLSKDYSFAYNIKLKSLEGGNPIMDFNGHPPGEPYGKAFQSQRGAIKKLQFKSIDPVTNIAVVGDRLLSLINPTDFWGEYTLDK
jgi:hypothetical protein